MADDTTPTVPPQTPGVVPGPQTSEYKITLIAGILSILVTVVGVASNFLDAVQSAGVGGRWVTIATTVVGVLGTVLTALGYTVTRGQVKAAASLASGAKPIIPPAAAAANLGA